MGANGTEQKGPADLWFLEGMDKVNRAIQGADDLDQMMRDVLAQVLAIFDCDRAWLVYPCNPLASSWGVPMECTKPEYPGACALGEQIPMRQEVASGFRDLLAADGPLRFDPESGRSIPGEAARRFGFKSFIGMALHPKIGEPWEFGLHQCSYARAWTPKEELLFQEIGRRLSDALNILLANRSLRQSEERYRSVVDHAADALFLVDYQGKIRDINQAACQSLGYSREELLSLYIHEVDPMVEADRHKEAFWEKLAPDKSFNFESQHRRKDGSLFPVEVSLGLMQAGGDRLMVALVRDITKRKQTDQRLRRSEERWRRSFEFSPAYISLTTVEDGRYVDVNEAYQRFLDLPREEIVGRTSSDMGFFRGTSDRENKLIESMREYGAIRDLELSVRLNSGEVRTVLWSAQPINIDGVIYYLSYGIDITERKRAEEILTQREEEYRTLVNNLPNFVVRYDKQLRRTLVNPAWERESGLTARQVINLPIYKVPIVPRAVPDNYLAALRKTLETGTTQTVEFSWVNAKKEELFLEYTLVPEFDRQGQVSGLLAVGHDLTERKQDEENLHRLNRELKAMSTCTQAMIRATDENALLEEICRIFCEEAGYCFTWVGYTDDHDSKTVRPVARAGHEDGYLAAANLTWADTEGGHSPAAKAIRSGRNICVQDFAAEPQIGPWRDAALQRGYRSVLALPLKGERGETFGALTIYSAEPDAFTTDEKRLLSKMVQDLAFGVIALRNREARTRAEEEVRLSEQRKTIFNQIANIFLTVADEDMYGEVLAVILRVMQSEFGVFGYLDDKGDLVVPSVTRDVWDQCQVPEKSVVFHTDIWGQSLWGKSIRQKKALYTNAPFNTPSGHITINNFLTVPVLFKEQSIGLFSVANKKEGYTEQDKDLLVEIVNNISPILNARLQRDNHECKRVAAEQALRARERELRSLVDNLPDLVARFDREGRHIFVSPSVIKASGQNLEHLIGKTIAEAMPEDKEQGERLLVLVKQAWESKEPNTCEAVWRFGSDEQIYEVRHIPELDEKGQVVSVLGIGRNITVHKRAEEERSKLEAQLRHAQKMEAVGTLAGGIAHDFNNILAVIMGYSEIALADTRQSHPAQKNLEQVLKAADRAKKLVHQILTFSRKVDHNLKPLNLNNVVERAAQLLEKTIPKMIKLEIDLEGDLQNINADVNQLDQVILNFGVNAVDAMPEGGELNITTKNMLVEHQACPTCGKFFSGPHVVLSISDSGQGMDQQTVEHIFEPFYTTKEVGKGTGLGLSIVYGIVKGHRGHISCQSTPGTGTTFTLFFPAIERQSSDSSAKGATAQPLSEGNEKILLIDDEATILKVGQWMLTTAGYTVHTASSGEEAIEDYLNEGKNFDLLIMDLSMPGMGGYKAMKTILEINPQAKVLIASGYGADGRMRDVLNSGAAGFVPKPFLRSDLLATVRGVLDKT
ncbi:MAG: PAS domain S-box protein [Deltaproteobacteria bacterium]|nr:PAS domain S-box protein [Deltaproteobacteria bacterium]